MTEPLAGASAIHIGLLTGGQDRHYSFGLAMALEARGVQLDFIGSDELDSPELHGSPRIHFLNLRGSQERSAGIVEKLRRVTCYYWRLIRYAVVAKPTVLHVLWNNKIELFDRTLLMLFYRAVGRKIVLTAHNVNAGRRDRADSWVNRLSLRVQYGLCDHIFVHTTKMKQDIVDHFGAAENRVTVIPYGANNAVRDSSLTPAQAKRKLGIGAEERTVLFFGQIGPYKGLDCLATAFDQLVEANGNYRLLIAGKPKPGADAYWQEISRTLQSRIGEGRVTVHIRHIPDDEIELYFKAADVLVLPYRDIFQSGVLFLGYSFGLPVIATDVGSLADDVLVGRTGVVCRPEDPAALASAIARFFESHLFKTLDATRLDIRAYSDAKHSWNTVATMTRDVYARILGSPDREGQRPAGSESDLLSAGKSSS